MKYSDIISIKTKFQRSTNIVFDSNCDSYILSTSSINSLRRILVTNTSNSIAITGPFGSGKSSLLIFLEALLIKNNGSQQCIDNLKLKDKDIFEQYQSFVGKKEKGFYSLKMVGEHKAFKKIFIDTLLEHDFLVDTQRFIKENKEASFTLLLKQLNKEITRQGYTGLLILIDELGKTIEYSSEKYLESDIHALQDLAEYVNKQRNMRLVVALHKSFKGYVHNSTYLSFTEWDKIQGRFDSIIFQDDFYELMHIFEQSIHVNDPPLMLKITDKIASVYDEYINTFKNKEISIEATSLTKLAPLHPFSSLALFHIFSKYFQNQRSVFSFLSAQEPHSFQDFIKHEINQNTLYTLDYLFDYINYLSNAYAVNMIDKESWILANEYIDSTNRLSNVQIKIIKAVALISAFGLEHLIQLDAQALALAFCSIKNIHEEIRELESKSLILYKRLTHSYALIEETTININEELTSIIKNQAKVNYVHVINEIIKNERILAKRFVIEMGTAKFFRQEYIDTDLDKSLELNFSIIFVNNDMPEQNVIDTSLKNKNCIYIKLPNSNQLKPLIEESVALSILIERKEHRLNTRVIKLLSGLISTNKNTINSVLAIKNNLYFLGQISKYSTEQLQQNLFSILQSAYPKMPVIINDLVNPIQKESNMPIGMKQLFEQMINHEASEKLQIEKFPPQMAIAA